MVETEPISPNSRPIIGQVRCRFCGELISGPGTVCDEQGQCRPSSVEETEELSLDHLEASDCILIETPNSLYRFSVVDLSCRNGILSGGRLRESRVSAFLLGANHSVSSLILKIGSSAVFQLYSAEGESHLTTSAITRLTHIRGGTPTMMS